MSSHEFEFGPNRELTQVILNLIDGKTIPEDGSRAGHLWTTAEEELVASLIMAGYTVGQIARVVGRNAGGIYARINDMTGIPIYNMPGSDAFFSKYSNIRNLAKTISPASIKHMVEHVTKPRNRYQLLAQKLIDQGYRKTSNNHRMVARIDDPNWIHTLAHEMGRAPADYYKPDGSLSDHWPDHYRRTRSQDVITVDKEVLKFIPSSSGDNTGFVPRDGEVIFNMEGIE